MDPIYLNIEVKLRIRRLVRGKGLPGVGLEAFKSPPQAQCFTIFLSPLDKNIVLGYFSSTLPACLSPATMFADMMIMN